LTSLKLRLLTFKAPEGARIGGLTKQGEMKMPEQKPSVGRIVHYQSYGTPGGEYTSQPRAAVITEVLSAPNGALTGEVGLCILNPTGQFFNQNVPFSETPKHGHWNWPPRS
jgi:hypothetical protein